MNGHPLPARQPLRVMLVDDEILARNFLRRILVKDGSIQHIDACSSVSEARERIRYFPPDVLFLDIQMPGASGFELLESLATDRQPVVVFTTAFAQFAPRAFDVQACDYLLKPFDEDRVFVALDRAKDALRNQLKRVRSALRITVPVGDRLVRLSADEIDWMAAEDNYVKVFCRRQTLMVRSSLAKLQLALSSGVLIRVHRSSVVNISRIKEVRHDSSNRIALVLADGTTVVCSRRYKKSVRNALRLSRGPSPFASHLTGLT